MSTLRRHARPLLLLLIVDVLWMGHVIRPIPGQAIGAHDMRGLFYPWLEFAHNALWRGELPLWDPAHFAGYPFLANPQVAFFYPPTWLTLMFPVNLGITLYLILHLWVAGSGIYLFLVKSEEWRVKRTTHHASLLAALTFMFSSFFMARIYAGHIGFLAVHAWAGWLLLGTDFMLRRPTWRRAVLASIPFGMMILAGHTTSLVYMSLLWGLYALFQSWQLKTSWVQLIKQMAIAVAVALLFAAIQLIPTAQLILLSARSAETTYEFASRFSLSPRQLLTLILPALFGQPTTVGYWGAETFEELTAYAGLLPLLVLPITLRLRNRRSYFWLSIAIFGLLLALGEQGVLHKLLFSFVPPFRLTRAPGRGLFFFTLAMSVLLGETLQHMQDEQRSLGRWFSIMATALTAAAIVGWGLNWLRLDGLPVGDARNRLIYQLDSSVITIVLVGCGGLVLWYYSRLSHKPQLLLLLAAFVLIDLGYFGRNLVRRESIAPPAYWSVAADVIGPDSQRVLPWGINLFDQNHPAQVGLDSVFGYNTLELASASNLFQQATDPRSEIYDLFAADYVVATVPLNQFIDGDDGLIPIDSASDAVWVYKRPNPLPIAWIEPDQDSPAPIQRPSQLGAVKIIEQRAGYWLIETATEQSAWLVVSELDYPGWRVTVDGESAEIQPAYGAFKSVTLPAGTYTVEFRFVPTIYLVGLILSLAGLALIAISIKKVSA